jgi:hypothetical protein
VEPWPWIGRTVGSDFSVSSSSDLKVHTAGSDPKTCIFQPKAVIL